VSLWLIYSSGQFPNLLSPKTVLTILNELLNHWYNLFFLSWFFLLCEFVNEHLMHLNITGSAHGFYYFCFFIKTIEDEK